MGLDGHTFFVDRFDHHSGLHLHAELGQRILGLLRQIFREWRQDPRRSVHQNDLCFFGVYGAKIVFKRLPRDLADGSGELYARGSCADDDEREPGAALRRIRNTLGNFEGVENFVPDVGRLFDAFHARRPFAPGVVSVIKGLRTGANDQRVVFDAHAVSQQDALGQRIDVGDLPEQNVGIFLPAQHAA